MTWHRQVLHVAAKDARLVGWLGVGWVVLVAMATAGAIEIFVSDVAGATSMVIVVATAMLLVAVAVQADSPAGGDSLWVTRPLSPASVFGAKLVIMAAIVSVGLAAQALVLLSYDVPIAEYPRLLFDSARALGLWLLLAAVVAALTPDLRMFAAMVVALTIAAYVAPMVFYSFAPAESEMVLIAYPFPPPLHRRTLFSLGLLVLLAYQYRRRRVLHGAIAAALLGIGFIGLSIYAPAHAAAHDTNPPELRTVAGAALNVDSMKPGTADVAIHLAGASIGHRYTFVPSRALVLREDGSTDTVPESRLAQGGSSVEMSERRPAVIRTRLPLLRAQAAELQRGAAVVELAGRMEIEARDTVGALPLVRGSSLRRDGRRITIRNVQPHGDGVDLEVIASDVALPGKDGGTSLSVWPRDVSFAVLVKGVDRARPESTRSRAAAQVIPGPDLRALQASLRVPLRAPLGEDARLEVRVWTPRGGYDVSITVRSVEENAP